MSKCTSRDNVAGWKCAGLTFGENDRPDTGDKIYGEPTNDEGKLSQIERISTDSCRVKLA